ncbi:hypothetical protein [Cryobacterium mannosilyticum]|uniref:hypothetical protein n=1 Tax=Cryobacterium mannosilyticum TaxID=1259190 RepID=UPI0030B9D775
MRRALDERSDLIEARASAALDEAILAGETWTRALGVVPRGSAAAAWQQHACAVAAYRDRYGIVGARPLGPAPEPTAQRLDFARARAAFLTRDVDIMTQPPILIVNGTIVSPRRAMSPRPSRARTDTVECEGVSFSLTATCQMCRPRRAENEHTTVSDRFRCQRNPLGHVTAADPIR